MQKYIEDGYIAPAYFFSNSDVQGYYSGYFAPGYIGKSYIIDFKDIFSSNDNCSCSNVTSEIPCHK